MNLLRTYSYERVDKEDPDELRHRKAQFLIYKVLEQAECRRRRSFPRLMTRKYRIKIGVRFRRVRRRIHSTVSRARACVRQKVVKQLKLWKRVLCGKDDVMALAHLC